MDKTQDAELEKGFESPDLPLSVDDGYFEDRTPLFEDDEDDLFDSRSYIENDFEYEPDGSFLD